MNSSLWDMMDGGASSSRGANRDIEKGETIGQSGRLEPGTHVEIVGTGDAKAYDPGTGPVYPDKLCIYCPHAAWTYRTCLGYGNLLTGKKHSQDSGCCL